MHPDSADITRAPLLIRLRAGDRHSFDEWVGIYWESVMRLLWKRVPAADAEDLAQEVFISIYRAVRKGGGPQSSDATDWLRYLYAGARSRVIDYWRRKNVQPAAEFMTELIGDENVEHALHSTQGDIQGSTPLALEQCDALRMCLERLDALSRTLCWLIFVESRSKRKVAQIINMPEATVRTKVVDSLASLRHCMETSGFGPDL